MPSNRHPGPRRTLYVCMYVCEAEGSKNPNIVRVGLPRQPQLWVRRDLRDSSANERTPIIRSRGSRGGCLAKLKAPKNTKDFRRGQKVEGRAGISSYRVIVKP